jgi:hypothetical protein
MPPLGAIAIANRFASNQFRLRGVLPDVKLLAALFSEKDPFMDNVRKPFVHLPIDAVDSVVYDPEDRFPADLYDRYMSFGEARDAARSSIEIMLDEGDYDGEDHRVEIKQMLDLLDSSSTYEELELHPEYRRTLEKLDLAQSFAA